MEITWGGQTFFQLKTRKQSVVIDPYNKEVALLSNKAKANVVTFNQPNTLTAQKLRQNGMKVVDTPGEYEIADVFVTGLYLPPTTEKAKSEKRNNLFVIYLDHLSVCHLGLLNHVPAQNLVEDLGSIDILLIPVGGGATLNASEAAEVISLIEPQIVIPMYYQLSEANLLAESDNLETVDKFLKEMGVATVETVDTVKITQAQLPEETQILLLEPKL
ncbi:MBL fold metallo-hydrolase [Anaerolineales bacterium HSG6]|nr:MBL fold metallo-hydrolase [Anaerolineales bacterium HSG6]MDM8532191.1 MBL fold metallo-hydrolase [Anaerolineales bacterium HSG25]